MDLIAEQEEALVLLALDDETELRRLLLGAQRA
jgi:hypothetical protein